MTNETLTYFLKRSIKITKKGAFPNTLTLNRLQQEFYIIFLV